MPQPTTCATCLSTRAIDIDRGLLAGRSIADLARMSGVHYDSIKRHRANGHIAAPSTASQLAPREGPVDSVASLEDILAQLDATDVSQMSARDRTQVQEQRRKTAESLSRARPPMDQEGPAQRALAALQEMVGVQDEVLELHPEAREAVAAAWLEWKRRRGS